MEHPTIQRYHVGGFYNYHFDWDHHHHHSSSLTTTTTTEGRLGNGITSFMVYLVADCIGGGTNFPFLYQPNDDTQLCNVIECDEERRDGLQGVIFKPIAGSAVYWENIHANDSGHKGVYHAVRRESRIEHMDLGLLVENSRAASRVVFGLSRKICSIIAA